MRSGAGSRAPAVTAPARQVFGSAARNYPGDGTSECHTAASPWRRRPPGSHVRSWASRVPSRSNASGQMHPIKHGPHLYGGAGRQAVKREVVVKNGAIERERVQPRTPPAAAAGQQRREEGPSVVSLRSAASGNPGLHPPEQRRQEDAVETRRPWAWIEGADLSTCRPVQPHHHRATAEAPKSTHERLVGMLYSPSSPQ